MWSSDLPGAMSGGGSKRPSGGGWENSSSREFTRIADSISRRSRSDFGKYRKGLSCAGIPNLVFGSLGSYVVLIIFRGEKFLNFVGSRQFDFNKPSVAVRVFVQFLGRGGKQPIHFHNFTGYWRVNVGNRLHGFHRSHGLALLHCGAHLGKIDIHDVAEFLLSVIRNPDDADVAFHADPLMFLGVVKICWIHYSYFARL